MSPTVSGNLFFEIAEANSSAGDFEGFVRPDETDANGTFIRFGNWMRAVAGGAVPGTVSGTLITAYSGTAPTGGVGSTTYPLGF